MRKRTKYPLITVCILVLLTAIYFFFIRFNFHTVIPKQVYRSAQPSVQQLINLENQYHLRSVIDLAPGGSRYNQEIRASQTLHLRHFDLPLQALKFPSIAQLKQLISLIDNAPKPVLVHCHAGADRTGLASAIVLILANYPIEKIQAQYSYWDLALSNNSVGKLVIPYYLCWLRDQQLSSNRQNFIRWLSGLQAGVNFPLPTDDPDKNRLSMDTCQVIG